jgi:hypothetical protein
MRMTKPMRQYAVDAAFESAKIEDMFEHFRNWNIAKGSYAADWDVCWTNWVDRQVTMNVEWRDRARRRAYFDRRAA